MSRKFFTAAVIATFAQQPCLAADEWRLVQEGGDMGTNVIYIGKDAVRMDNQKCGYQFICKGPDWKVHCFRASERIEWTSPLSAFGGKLLTTPYGLAGKNNTETKPVKSLKFAGVPCTMYSTGASPQSFVYGADNIPVAKQIPDFLTRCYDMPDCGKVPIYRSEDRGKGREYEKKGRTFLTFDMGHDLRGGVLIRLKTTSAQKITLKPSDFSLPKGFKQTYHLPQVAFSNAQKDDLTETFGSVGFSSRDSKRK